MAPNLCREDFLVSACNEEALAWIESWPGWSTPVASIYGPKGCGKTHLAHVWSDCSSAEIITPEIFWKLEPDQILSGQNAFVLEDLETIVPGDRFLEEKLFHFYNMVREEKGWLLLTGETSPARWPVTLPDLKSRLSAVFSLRMTAPDDELFDALLVKLFHDKQIALSPEVLNFLTARCERSFDVARRLVAQIDRASLALHREITVPLVRPLLEDLEETGE